MHNESMRIRLTSPRVKAVSVNEFRGAFAETWHNHASRARIILFRQADAALRAIFPVAHLIKRHLPHAKQHIVRRS